MIWVAIYVVGYLACFYKWYGPLLDDCYGVLAAFAWLTVIVLRGLFK